MTWSARCAAPTTSPASGRRRRYTIIPDAGHSAMETGTRSALVAGMEAFKSVA